MHLARQNPNAIPTLVRWEALFTEESGRTEFVSDLNRILHDVRPVAKGLGAFSVGAADGAHFDNHPIMKRQFNARHESDFPASLAVFRSLHHNTARDLVGGGLSFDVVVVDFDETSIEAADAVHALTATITKDVDQLEVVAEGNDIFIPSIASLAEAVGYFVDVRASYEAAKIKQKAPDAPALPAL